MHAFCSDESMAGSRRAHGNPCQVTLLASPPALPSPPHTQTLESTTSSSPQCISWPLGKQHAGVACWTNDGTPIVLCGHGLLCCAALWMDQWCGKGTLTMNGADVSCRTEGGKIWLGFDPLEIQSSQIPPWANSQFSAEPVDAATAGPDNGYLILQWPANFSLTSLPAPAATLAQDTQRALIVTCAVDPAAALLGENIHYRYFAPQYGVIEDLATGSAMRVLASYWQQRDLGTALTAYQDSDAGGLLFSEIRAGKIWVGGRTFPTVTGDNPVE